MSHRCSLCDFSPTVPSIYNDGLTHTGVHKNHLLFDRDTEEYICAECARAIREPLPLDDGILDSVEPDDDIQEFQRFAEE